MPTYDYQCNGCGKAFEVFQRMSDEPVSSCLDCGAPARRRISGGGGFIFKGEGFYITDHRSREYRDEAAADAGKEPVSASVAQASDGASAKSPGKGGDKLAASSSGSGSEAPGADSGGSTASGGAERRTRPGSGR